jgi:uncharacterized membrane protein HdeD (DUF308 family)
MSDVSTAAAEATAALDAASQKVGALASLEADAQAVLHLPTMADKPAVVSYLTSAVALVVGVVAIVHPGFTESGAVEAAVAPAAILVAGLAQFVDRWRFRSGRNAAVASGQVKIQA